jgi:hypothetical protein
MASSNLEAVAARRANNVSKLAEVERRCAELEAEESELAITERVLTRLDFGTRVRRAAPSVPMFVDEQEPLLTRALRFGYGTLARVRHFVSALFARRD